MTIAESLAAFAAAAALLTIVPGLDTALVLRTAAADGPRRAFLASVGIAAGCLAWGLIVAAGLGALLAVSQLAFNLLRWVGAAYLAWLGVGLLLRPRRRSETFSSQTDGARLEGGFMRGFLTNILNPKVGVFYVSFLPQFIPPDTPVAAMTVALAAIHGLLGIVWFAALILCTRPVMGLLSAGGVVSWLDRATGGLFLAFAAGLAFGDRR